MLRSRSRNGNFTSVDDDDDDDDDDDGFDAELAFGSNLDLKNALV